MDEIHGSSEARPHQPLELHILQKATPALAIPATSAESRPFQPPRPYSNQSLLCTFTSEDCLFLNIWVPHPRPSAPASVLVWIHGGGFLSGSGSLDRSYLAATENIIVASMNYRLSALGFLSLTPSSREARKHVRTKHLALSWLKENMAAFGGDPTRITLGGQSAGAASVGFHLLSPVSQDLFAQATLQSGASISPWAWVNPKETQVRGKTLGQLLGCSGNSNRIIVSCLRRENHSLQNWADPRQKVLLDTVFVPTTDGEFLPGAPRKLLEAEHFPAKPVLTGFTSTEGSLFLSAGAPGFSLYNDSLINRQQLLEGLHLLLPDASDSTVEMIDIIYSQGEQGEEQGEAQYRNALVRASGDYLFLCPVAMR
uniref:Uncharacterized protein n=1 Tax=Sphaerodactylus townsendi TaxID=933632 RepID=A0ACB8EGE7_9SAUR